MRPRRLVVALLTVTVLALGASAGAGTVVALDNDTLVSSCAAAPNESFDDPEEGNATVGWFDGYWYNESIDIDPNDELSEDEVRELVARTAARVEAMRCLAFEEIPPIDIVDDETFANEIAANYEEWDERTRRFDNQQFETLLTIGSDEDTIDVREAGTSGTLGFYDYAAEEIVLVSNDREAVTLDEPILAHELTHALQDQHFDLERYNRSTMDRNAGVLGVIEGDARRIELAYAERCDTEAWGEACTRESPDLATDAPPNWGLMFVEYQPYSDGPAFVERAYDEGDWDAVNALYEEIPNTSAETIDPALHGEITPAETDIRDRSSAEWTRMRWNDSPNYNEIGRVGLSSMFMGQSAEAIDEGEAIVAPSAFQNPNADGDGVDQFDPYEYDLDVTDDWRGDRFYAYEDGDGRTASLWQLNWEDETAAEEFVDAYEQLAEYRGGYRVPGYDNTWRFGAESDYDMALTIVTEDDRVRIVTAPTIQDLDEIHRGIAPERTGDPGEPFPNQPWSPSDPGDDGEPSGPIEGPWDEIPTVVIVPIGALAVLAGLSYAIRRR